MGITLYELVPGKDESARNFSSPVWKTKIDLAILDIPYQSTGRSFRRIIDELPKLMGKGEVTVPTIEVGGKFITDSWTIAEHLERTCATSGTSLGLSSDAGKAFCKFLDIWTNTTLDRELRPLIIPKVYELIDPPSQAYFLSSRFDGDRSKFEAMLSDAADRSFVDAQCTTARARLQVVEQLLAFNPGGFLMGAEPSHADASVFGYYAFSRLNRDLIEGVWEHDSLPEVRAWVARVMDRFVKREELY